MGSLSRFADLMTDMRFIVCVVGLVLSSFFVTMIAFQSLIPKFTNYYSMEIQMFSLMIVMLLIIVFTIEWWKNIHVQIYFEKVIITEGIITIISLGICQLIEVYVPQSRK